MRIAKPTIGILTLSMISLSGIFITPVIGLVAEAFPQASLSSVQMIVSVSTLTALVGAWCTGKLVQLFSRKTVALLGIAGVLVFGFLPFIVHSSLSVVIALSGCLGVCLGLINNTLPAFISEHYDVEQRQGMMGKQVAFASIGAMVFIYAAGMLGTVAWYYAYLVYLFAAIVLLVCWFTLPKDAVAEDGNRGEQKFSITQALTPKVLFLLAAGFFFLIANNAYSNNLALLVAQNNLGDSGTAGLATTIGQLGGLIAGLLIGRLAKRITNHLLMLGFVIEGVALLVVGFAPNLLVLVIGCFFVGAGLSVYYAQAPFLITVLEKPYLIPLGIAAMTTANALGGFASPVVVNAINGLFGSTAAGAMCIGATMALIVAVVLGVTNYQKHCLDAVR
ncbi:MFS transporter [Bifidobacterium lemurum]|uniref:MFS transporter n=1 Tax=Bifidobacterium lemurum TaxID=1603886 RepID=A0A261FKA5_9BIFI|nr:MFS transporter [Bifidobacterium lemurum]OZG59445.1 MFS transporter [Bifidobacterium lemurum]QOL34502.1 MFS transporter [Bifidobacterium lemurum]